MKLSKALSRIVLWMYLVLCMAIPVSAHSHCHQAPDLNIRKEYGRAVFRVIGYKKDGSALRLGSAILIHPDGFAVTASHIFDLEGNVLLEYGKAGYPQNGRLRLQNVESGYEIEANIWKKRKSPGDPDIAILKSASAPPDSLKFPDLSLGWYTRETGGAAPYFNELAKYVVLGYRIQDDDIKVHQFSAFNVEWDPSKSPIFVLETAGPVFGGQSGSSAIASDGMSFGVLRGEPTKEFGGGIETITYRFTPTAELARLGWASELPLTARTVRLVERIRQGQLDAADRGTIRNLRIIEIWQLVDHLALNLKAKPLSGIDRWLTETLVLMAACRGMPDIATRIQSLMPGVLAGSNQSLDVARVFFARHEGLRSRNVSETFQQAALAESLAFFELFHKNAKPEPGKYYSNAYYDFARAAYIASKDFPLLGKNPKDALRYAQLSEKLDPTNSNAHLLQAQIYGNQLQQFERAVDSANTAIKIKPQIRESVERDIRRYERGREAAGIR